MFLLVVLLWVMFVKDYIRYRDMLEEYGFIFLPLWQNDTYDLPQIKVKSKDYTCFHFFSISYPLV